MAEYKLIPENAIKINLPNVQQSTWFSCGPACVQSVMAYFGVGPDEQDEYVERLKAEPYGGTAPNDIVNFCKEYGLSVKLVKNMKIEALVNFLEKGRPVICAIQAYGTKKDYKNWIKGHYVVAIGYDKKHIYFEDPLITGKRAFVPIDEFIDRWHDYDKHGNEYQNLGIVIWKRGKNGHIHRAKKLN